MRHIMVITTAILAVNLSGCASLGLSLDSFKKHNVTYPEDMDQDFQLVEISKQDGFNIEPAVYQPDTYSVEIYDGPKMSGFEAVSYAQRQATVKPSTQNYMGAMQLYPYAEGSLYEVYASPSQVTDIALQKGEGLITISAGDTENWTVGDTVSGSGTDMQVHIIVKPKSAGLATNAVITSTKRTYYLDLKSFAKTYMAAVSWRYPQEVLKEIFKEKSEQPQLIKTRFETASLDVEPDNIRFDYMIMGDKPDWRPTRVFDDGRKVFIQFPKDLSVSEAPPLFVKDENSKHGHLVNYRVKGDYYVVDRLFQSAELRLGEKDQTIVHIERLP